MRTQPRPRQVLTQIKKLEKFVNDWEMIPATARYRNKVILALLSKALTVGRAVCALVQARFPAEAFGVSRTLVEIYFCVRYMSNKETESRVQTYAEYWAKVHEEWGNAIAKHYPSKKLRFPPFHEKAVRVAEKFKSKHSWTGHGGQAKLMALEEDTFDVDERGQPFKSEFDYDVIYFWTSQFVHATVISLYGHASEPCAVFRVRARMWAENDRAADAMFNTLNFLSNTVVCACRAMREEQPEAILEAMRKLTQRAARANEMLGRIRVKSERRRTTGRLRLSK